VGLRSALRTAVSLQVAVLCVLPVLAQSSEGTSWHSAKTAQYELYAKSNDEIIGGQRDMDFAVAKFRQYFGEDPPLIAVVLFDSPADVQKYDYSNFVKRRIVFLPWITASGLEAAIDPHLRYVAFSDLGVILMNKQGIAGAWAAQTLPMGTVHEVLKDDVIVGVNHQACTSISDFQKLYAAAVTGEKVELELRRNGQTTNVTFAKPSDAAGSEGSLASAGTGMTRALSHEAGHKYLQAWLRKRADANAAANNTKPAMDAAIPEWFDETVATLFEGPELQNQRKDYLSHHLDQMIPLEQLLAMANPAKASKSDLPQQPPQGSQTQVTVIVKTSTDNPTSSQGQLFYAETLSFGQFVSAKFGPTAVRDLAIGVTTGQTTEQVLGALNRSPIQLSELEAMWLGSIRK
jgi:hypothetical protein